MTGPSIRGVGLACPLGLGRESCLEAWMGRDGSVFTQANDRWPTEGFPRPDAGLVPDFVPRKQLPDRKAVKLMSREVQLGVFAALEASGGRDVVARTGIDPRRFGAYAAAGYEVSSLEDHEAMLAASRDPDQLGRLSVSRLMTEGRDLLSPIAPLRVLPNMGLFHAGVTLGLRGPHLALGSSPAAGLACLGEATEALSFGEIDAALALATDAQVEEFRAQLLVEAGVVPSLAPAEGAAALLVDCSGDGPRVLAWAAGQEPTRTGFGDTSDEGAARRALYEQVIAAAGGSVDACIADLWGEPERDACELSALPGGELLSTRPLLGWLGAAHGLVDAALGAELVRRGELERVLVTASGLAGDITAVVIGAAP